jgi:hypothetical protein
VTDFGGSPEIRGAEAVIAHADASMLVLADRNFYSLAFWQRSCASGAKLLFRVRNDQRLPREVELPDGSYLSTLYPTEKARRQQTEGVRVRVIEYALDGIEEQNVVAPHAIAPLRVAHPSMAQQLTGLHSG